MCVCVHIWSQGSEKGPMHSPERSIKVDTCNNVHVHVIKNIGRCNSMMDRLISSALQRSCKGHKCLL